MAAEGFVEQGGTLPKRQPLDVGRIWCLPLLWRLMAFPPLLRGPMKMAAIKPARSAPALLAGAFEELRQDETGVSMFWETRAAVKHGLRAEAVTPPFDDLNKQAARSLT